MLAILLVLTLLALTPSAALAADVHSPNTRLVGSLDLDGLLSDIAFWGDTAVVGYMGDPLDPTDDGLRVVDISNPERPRLLGSLTCPGSHYDVSVWKDIAILSVNELQSSPECGGDPESSSGEAFAGLHVISIADPRRPVRVASVPLCLDGPVGPGSHNNTLVPDLDRADPRLIVYSSITCVEIVEIPLRDPARARHVGTINAAPDIGCHDITVHLERKLAWCGFFQSQLWDIADPLHPRQVAVIENPLLDQDHSAVFSVDGKTVAVSDERFADRSENCYGGTRVPSGAIWFYDVSDPAVPIPRGMHQLAFGGIDAFCTAHQLSLVPLRGDRDVLSAAWYRGGTEIVDFSDPASPRVLAHFVGGPDEPERFSQPWAAYWYRGYTYLTNSAWAWPLPVPYDYRSPRGLEVLRVDDPALQEAIDLPHLNAQTQEPIRTAAPPATPTATPGRSRSCRLRRLVLQLRLPRGRKIRSVHANVGGRRLPARPSRARRGRVIVDLTGVPAGRHVVVVRVRISQRRGVAVRRRSISC